MNLPLDLLIEIFSQCQLKDLHQIRLTNRANQAVVKNNRLWLILLTQTFKGVKLKGTDAFAAFWYHYAREKLISGETKGDKSTKRLSTSKYRIIMFRFRHDPPVQQIQNSCRNSYERMQAHQLASQLGLYHTSQYDPQQTHFNQTLINRSDSGCCSECDNYTYRVSSTPISYVLISRKPLEGVQSSKPDEKLETVDGYGSSVIGRVNELKWKWKQ